MATPYIGVYATSYGPYAGAQAAILTPGAAQGSDSVAFTAADAMTQNTLTLTATRQYTTLPIEFLNPATNVWADGTQQQDGSYRVVFTGIPAGDYQNLKCRLKGSNPQISAVFPQTVTVVGSGGTNPALYNVLGKGHSRMANQEQKFIPGDPQPRTGYANGWLLRTQINLASNSNYGGFFNRAIAGDTLAGMSTSDELDDLQAYLVAGQVNILFLHNYINDILLAVAGSGQPTTAGILSTVQQRLQAYYAAIKARAQAVGAELRIIQFVDPSAVIENLSPAQTQMIEDCVSGMRTWLRANYQQLGALVLADICSDNRFIGLNSPTSNPFYLNENSGTRFLHYNVEGNQFIFQNFAKPALLAAAAGTATIIEVASQGIVPAPSRLKVEYDDADPALTFTGFLPSQQVGGNYSNGTTRISQQFATEATVTVTENFSGSPEEGVRIVMSVPANTLMQYQVDGGAWMQGKKLSGVVSFEAFGGIGVGSHTITCKFYTSDGSPLAYGDNNFDGLQIFTRVP